MACGLKLWTHGTIAAAVFLSLTGIAVGQSDDAARATDEGSCAMLRQLKLDKVPRGPAIVISAQLIDVPGGVRRVDFTSNHVVAVVAKAITTSYYRKPIRYSYIAGQSKGAQGVLMEAQGDDNPEIRSNAV